MHSMERHRALSSTSVSSRGSSPRSAKDSSLMEFGNDFEPTAATAAVFLYAEGSTILCLHHDTLALDKKFQRHTEDVLLIAVDNVSETPGRLVVSYDAGLTAIVWDLFSGEEVSRFASYEPIRVAAWLRNGNITFGNSKGEIILFEPSTSEHISARTIYDPITAIAPNADCRTYAIGYMNGSILIASLQPNFTIRHTLTTSRSPSTVVSLAWHGSSRGQRSDMLACQNRDGDLRVWSIAKESTGDVPKIVRILHRSSDYTPGPNWLSWSKNGKIIQHSERETCIWDVKTKNVTFDLVPTPRDLTGIAAHGPTGALFTVSRNKSVQQFDLDPPAMVATNAPQAPLPPPSPPVSVEERSRSRTSSGRKSSTSRVGLPKAAQIPSKGRDEDLTPIQRIDNEMSQLEKRRHERSGPQSATSSTVPSIIASGSSHSSYAPRFQGKASPSSRATTKDGTVMSYGSSIQTGEEGAGRGGRVIRSSQSVSSIASSQRSSRSRGGSRLRNEVIPSPETPKGPTDLFAYISARLSDVPYRNPSLDQTTLTAADLRLQMLNVVFGWKGDIEELIQDEKSRHPKGSSNAVVLSKWLNEDDNEIMASMVGADDMSSSNWMLLALSQIGSQSSMKKVGQSFVQKLLEKEDINSAATILLILGEHDDAVEIYVSHKMYMEAVLLTAVVFSDHWQRISELLRKWGEHAVTHGLQQLAIRCFVCTGQEPTEDWTSPRAQKATFADEMQSIIGSITSPTESFTGGMSNDRMAQKRASLKLITSFGDRAAGPAGVSKLHNPANDRTPVNAIGVTPIDTAVTPGGFLRTPRAAEASARTATPGGHSRVRLPSIGETPTDVTPQTALKSDAPRLPTPLRTKISRSQAASPMVLTASTYSANRDEAKSPMSEVSKAQLPSPAAGAFTALREESRSRNGSQDRKPEGLQINWPPMESILTGDYMSPVSDQGSSRSRHQRSNTESTLPTPVTGKSLASQSNAHSPMQTGRNIDLYISSLEEASFKPYGSIRSENNTDKASLTTDRGRDRGGARARSSSRKARPRELSEDRGRTGRQYVRPAKKSPSSPIPMSPEDILPPSQNYDDERFYSSNSPASERLAAVERLAASEYHKTASTSSRTASRTRPVEARSSSRQAPRRSSPERRAESRAGSRVRGRAHSSRRTSPDDAEARRARGRSNHRIDAPQRSPASPLPMSPQSVPEAAAAAEAEEGESRQRYRSRQRSTSRKPRDTGAAIVGDRSADQERVRARSTSQRPRERALSNTRRDGRGNSNERRPQHERTNSLASAKSGASAISSVLTPLQLAENAAKREQAAKDLEDRRKSLARRPSAPPIPLPEELSSRHGALASRYIEYEDDVPQSNYRDLAALRSRTVSPLSVSGLSASGHSASGSSTNPSSVGIGLPATPRAMRHPKDNAIDPKNHEDIPDVPHLPESKGMKSQAHNEHPDVLASLPSTRYMPHRPTLSRAASAPIPEALESPPPLPANLPTHPAFSHVIPPSTRRHAADSAKSIISRKISPAPDDAQPGTLGYHGGHDYDRSEAMPLSIDETLSREAPIENSASAEPEILPELQHLAQARHHASPPAPPNQGLVPPPPPMHHDLSPGSSVVTDGSIGVIDIAIDDGHQNVATSSDLSTSTASRGRNGQESFGSKIRERMRSASRSRKTPAPSTDIRRMAASPYESIQPGGAAPYESIQPAGAAPYESIHLNGSDLSTRSSNKTNSPQIERHPREVRAGMTPEMTRMGFTEGGMI